MILEYIEILDDVKYDLKKIQSLMELFSAFHCRNSPCVLEAGIYLDIGGLVSNLVSQQKTKVENISTKLGEINKELPTLKKDGESI